MHTLIEAPAGIAADAIITLRPEMLTEIAEADPAGIAVSTGDYELTNLELDRWSNRVARMLLRLGAGPDTSVAIAVSPSVESIVTVWAIAKTGAVTVDATAAASVGVTTKARRDELPASMRCLVLDDRSTLVGYMTGSDAPVTDIDRRAALLSA